MGKHFLDKGGWRCSRLMALFKGLWSSHTSSFPFGFLTITNSLTQSVLFWRSSLVSKSTIRFNSFSNLRFAAKGIFLTWVITGVTVSSILIWRVFLVLSLQQNKKKSDKNYWLFMFTVEIRFIRFGLSLVTNPRKDADFETTLIN